MSAMIPQNPITQADFQEWYNLRQQLAAMKAIADKEMLLRKKLFGGLFPNAVEGTNTLPMEGGYVLKAVHKIDRKIDMASFDSNRDRFREHGIIPEGVVRYKPELNLPEYKKLTAEQQAVFDECLVIKPASPELTLVPPKAAGPGGQENLEG